MSSAPTPPKAPAPLRVASSAPAAEPVKEIIVYGHTMLFYWWPVWVFGYLFAILTYFGDQRAAIIPSDSVYKDKVITLEKELSKEGVALAENGRFTERMALSSTPGIVYAIILILTILITTVPLRGISSVVVILGIALIVVSISFMGWWDEILRWFAGLRIHMNMGFYMFLSTVVFIMWAIVFFIYDRMNYWRITPGQITHKYVLGGGERTFDTEGLAFTKLRDDLFRHLILGLGSGDLMMDPMKSGGAAKEDLAIHNVLFVGTKLQQIEDLIGRQSTAKPGV